MDPSPVSHPLLLLEMAELIASYLSKKALSQCILVSRHWHHVFHPSLWRTVALERPDSLSTKAFASMTRYAPLVHILKLEKLTDDYCIRLLQLQWPILQSIEIDLSTYSKPELYIALQNFMERHGPLLNTIRYRSITRFLPTIRPHDFSRILQGCQGHGRLSTLSLNGVPISLDYLTEESRHLLNGLTSFSLIDIRFHRPQRQEHSGHKNPLLTPTWQLGRGEVCKIHDLTIQSYAGSTIGISVEYPLIIDCQELRSLTWMHSIHPFGECPLANDLRKGWWPYLNRLHLPRTDMTDADLSDILLAMGLRPLKELDVEGTKFGERCAKALLWRGVNGQNLDHVHHCWGALEGLFVAGSNDTGAMALQFLCSFPNLKRFSGSMLTKEELVSDARPWVCMDLQELKLPLAFRYTEVDDDVPHSSVFLKRLSLLKRLEVLHTLDYYKLHRRGLQSFTLGLQLDMEPMKTLTRLRDVSWGTLSQSLTLRDIQWMMMYWPALEVVQVGMRECIDIPVADYLEKHGIHYSVVCSSPY